MRSRRPQNSVGTGLDVGDDWWGVMPMPANAGANERGARTLVQWVLKQK